MSPAVPASASRPWLSRLGSVLGLLAAGPLVGIAFYFFGLLAGGLLVAFGGGEFAAEQTARLSFVYGCVVGALPLLLTLLEALGLFGPRAAAAGNAATLAPSVWRMPLQTGEGLAMSLFLFSFAFVPAALAALLGVLGLIAGHWVVGPALMLLGAFFVGAFWGFPRAAWLSWPADLELDAQGFRVRGGYSAGLGFTWSELDARACRIEAGQEVLASRLVAVTRAGKEHTVAEGEEQGQLQAVLDAWRSVALREPGEPTGPRPQSQVVSCNACGAPARPVDAETTPCVSCGEPVALPQSVRERLRGFAVGRALQAKTERVLAHLLEQPRARLTTVLLSVVALSMLASWLVSGVVVGKLLWSGALSFGVVLLALAGPLLATIALGIAASVVSGRRGALGAVSVDFAALSPLGPGQPCGCRVCGGLLPDSPELVVRCAYCSAPNVIGSARPRALGRGAKKGKKKKVRRGEDDTLGTSLEDLLEAQRGEQLFRWLALGLIGAPALAAALAVLRALVPLLGV